jgi:predicted ATPase
MPIIGRDREVADVSSLLREVQVVTLAGAGGIGKTRLAVEVAKRLNGDSDAVWFVDLGPLADPQLVTATVGSAVGVELSSSLDPADALVAALKARHVTLVMDNCEHLVDEVAGLIETIVEHCPNVRVLATSREPLGLDAEAVYRLGTLDDASSMELFSAHAYQVEPQFSPTGRNLPVLRDICKRLDGIALAIQLAAACVRVMPLGQLRARLDGKFRLLIAGSRTVMLPRHQTMQALIDWSYELLSEQERTIFRRLGVLNGGFTAHAAASIAASQDVDRDAIAAGLRRLVEKSMVVLDDTQRYSMLGSIRQYALEHLQDAGEELRARRAHVAFFAARAAEAEAAFGTGSEEEWLATYVPDLDNFRSALEWARGNDAELAARIAASLADFWEFNNLAGEGLRRSEAILASLRHPNEPSALPLLLATARLALAADVCVRWKSPSAPSRWPNARRIVTP